MTNFIQNDGSNTTAATQRPESRTVQSRIATPEAKQAASDFFGEWRRSLAAASFVEAALAEAFDRFAIMRVKEEKPQHFWDYSDGFVHGYEKRAAEMRTKEADLAAVKAERDALRNAATIALDFILHRQGNDAGETFATAELRVALSKQQP